MHNEESCNVDEYKHHHTPHSNATTKKCFNSSKRSEIRKSRANKSTRKSKKLIHSEIEKDVVIDATNHRENEIDSDASYAQVKHPIFDDEIEERQE